MRYSHTALSVSNILVSRKFYEELFGLSFYAEAERKELKVRFLQLKDELGNIVELFQHDEPLPLNENLMDLQRMGIKHVSFVVDNLEQTLTEALSKGASLIREIQEGKTVKRNAFIADPDGIVIELVEI